MLLAQVWADEDAKIAREAGPFRFPVGARVECSVGEGDRRAGAIIKHYYREAAWPTDRWAPYQVELDDGMLIFAPADIDECIRAAEEQ